MRRFDYISNKIMIIIVISLSVYLPIISVNLVDLLVVCACLCQISRAHMVEPDSTDYSTLIKSGFTDHYAGIALQLSNNNVDKVRLRHILKLV